MVETLQNKIRALCALVLFSCLFQVTLAQDLSFSDPTHSQLPQQSEQENSLLKVLNELENKQQVSFAYQKKHLEGKTVDHKPEEKEDIEVYLQEVLPPLNLSFKKVEDVYIIQPLRNTPLKSSGASAAPPVQHSNFAAAQNPARVITGVVTDENNAPLPGVNVVVKGTAEGTVTDVEGKYSLNVNADNAVLIFSYIGYTPEEVAVNNQETINVSLLPDIQSLSEVVVTALGIEKNKDALSYAVAEVQGSEFVQAREPNIANALTGKVAGVNVSGLNTGPGGSSRVIIRGNGSLNGNNQPLYVVNGMPIDNTTPGGGPSTNAGGNNVDRGDGIAGINPDDIESMSVLKGGTAAALYGSRAANGVILITTKKGRSQQGIGVEYNTSFTFETPAVFPDYQYEYGQGVDGVKPTTQAEAISTGRLSFGAPMDGQPYVQFDGVERPYSPVSAKDNIKNFWRTGTNYVNTIALTGGSENINYRFSLSNTDAKSMQPNSDFNRKTANLNVNAFLGKKLSIEAVAQYNLEQANNRPSAGDALGNPSWAVNMVANTVDIRDLAPGYDADGREIQWNPVPLANNSYFVVNRFQNHDTKNRFIGQMNVRYDITDKLFVQGRVARDFYNYKYEYIVPTNTAYIPRGEYQSFRTDVVENNSLLTLNYNETFGNFGLSAILGGNQRTYSYDQTTINGEQFVIPYFYSYTNLNTLTTTPLNQRTGTNSLFGSVDLDYKGIAFLTLTGREDWFSTLSPENNSIFYPSVGGSFILTEAFSLPKALSYTKIRASWAQVGGATPDPYIINQSYNQIQGGHNGRPVQGITQTNGVNLVNNPNLRPLTSTTYEVGFDAQLLDGRLGVDFTYYDRKTTDDIVQTTISEASGYTQALLNVGELSNRGVELLLSGRPVKTERFGWDVSYNMAYNHSEVLKLAEGLNTITVASGIGGATINNDVGRPYGVIKGYRIARAEDGQVIYNTNSGYEQRGTIEELGLGVAPWTMGITNNFNYKDFSLNVLIDGKFGNSVFSTQNQYAYRFGLLKETLPGREDGLVLTGVDEEGNPYTGEITVDQLDTYYDNRKNYTELFVYDGSFVKLRQVILSYNLPVSKLNWIKLQSASFSFVARNLAILYRETENFDPESSYTSGNAQGFEAFGLPRARSYGFNLMVKF